MGQYETLKNMFDETPYMSINCETHDVELIDGAEAMRRLMEESPSPRYALLNLHGALAGFAKQPGVGYADRVFTLNQIAVIAGFRYAMAYKYCALLRIIVPEVRDFCGGGRAQEMSALFDWSGAFCAGVVGALYRIGCTPDILATIQPLLSGTSTAPRRRERITTT